MKRTNSITLALVASLCLGLVTISQAADTRTDDNRKKNENVRTTGLMYSKNIIGQQVRNHEGKDIGHLDELILSPAGQIQFGVLAVGKNFLGIGDKKVAIPWDDLTLSATQQGYRLHIDPKALRDAPEYKPNQVVIHDTDPEYRRMSREAMTYQGKVTAIDQAAGKVTVRRTMISHEFKLAPTTQADTVKVGDEVEVTYTKDVDGNKVAESIHEVLDKPAGS